MCLHSMWISCLGQNLKQLIVGQEIETRKSTSLNLQIVLHFLLNILKFLIEFLEFPKQLFTSTAIIYKRSFKCFQHYIFPKLVNNYKLLILLRQLFLDILCTEDVFKIHPLSLACQPLINNL
jgi:hypothetical protein